MKFVATVLTAVMTAGSAFAADPCTSNGGKIENGSLEKSLVRVCTLSQSAGWTSSIGLNDLVLHLSGKPVQAVETFLKKTTISPPKDGPKVCEKNGAKLVSIKLVSGEDTFCMFEDGSLIDAFTLSNGSTVSSVLANILNQ